MATIFRIKRSDTAGNPASLAQGELAYSALTDNGSNGGDRLYIGTGTETANNAANHVVVGGKFFTDMLDHTAGALTANSALIVDSNSKIDTLNVDNLTLDGNTLSSTNIDGNITLNPNGAGTVDVSTSKIVNVSDPVANQDAATKSYVDNFLGDTTGIEQTQDIVAAMFSGGTQSGVGVTYDDGAGTISLNVSDPTLTFDGDLSGTGTITDLGDVTYSLTLDTVNANVGSFGSTTQIPVVTVNAKGLVTAVSTASITTSIGIAGDSGTDTVALATDTLTFTGGEGIDTAVTNNVVTITGEDATTTNKGVASFNTNDFSVVAGAVSIASLGNAQLDNSSVTFGSTEVALGATSTTLAGLTSVTVDNLLIDGNAVAAQDTNGNVTLSPDGTGTVDVSSARITSVGTPTQSSDAVTKAYADSLATGVDAKESVRAATVGPITMSNTQIIDGVSLAAGDRVLVKDQADASTNGIYDVVDGGAWTRSSDFDEPYEVTANAYTFVEEGTVNGDNGYVLTTNDPITLGTHDLVWVQFSGAGQVVAGDGLSKTGNTIDVNVANGIEVSGDNVQLASSVAGDGLTYAAGTIDVVGTSNRISVAADAIDISANYVGQSSITTLGTITTGTWTGDTVAVTYGGTGLSSVTSSALLVGNGTSAMTAITPSSADGSFLKQDATGNPVWTNEIDGGTY